MSQWPMSKHQHIKKIIFRHHCFTVFYQISSKTSSHLPLSWLRTALWMPLREHILLVLRCWLQNVRHCRENDNHEAKSSLVYGENHECKARAYDRYKTVVKNYGTQRRNHSAKLLIWWEAGQQIQWFIHVEDCNNLAHRWSSWISHGCSDECWCQVWRAASYTISFCYSWWCTILKSVSECCELRPLPATLLKQVMEYILPLNAAITNKPLV